MERHGSFPEFVRRGGEGIARQLTQARVARGEESGQGQTDGPLAWGVGDAAGVKVSNGGARRVSRETIAMSGQVRAVLEDVGVSACLHDEKVQKALQYAELVVTWRLAADLTSLGTAMAVFRELMAPSLLLQKVVPAGPSGEIADLGGGSGAGAAAIALAWPSCSVTVLEAKRKKAEFCRYAARRCGIENLSARWCRVTEEAPTDLQGRFNVVTIRAVAGGARPLRWAAPLLAPDGLLVVWRLCEKGVPGDLRLVRQLPWARGEIGAYARH